MAGLSCFFGRLPASRCGAAAFFLAGSLLLGAVASARAEDTSVFIGVGALGCSKYVDNISGGGQRAAMVRESAMSWFQGMASGMNHARYGAGERMINLPTMNDRVVEDAWIFLENYCRQNPKAILMTASMSLINLYIEKYGFSAVSKDAN